MRKWLRAAALLGLLAGCATVPPTIGDPAPQLVDRRKEQAYQEILERYTDRAEVYDGFDTRLFAGTTFQTTAFREARVQRLAEFKLLPPQRVEELLAEERAEVARFNEFFLGVHVNDSRFEDFARGKQSIWRLVMLTPLGEAEPVSVERIGRANLDMRAMYPYLGVFWVAYRVRFPKVQQDGTPIIPESASHVTLRLASTLGRAELRVHAR